MMKTINQTGETALEKKEKLQLISLFDLGDNEQEMLKNWYLLKEQDIKIALKEYPAVDLYQVIDDDLEILEFVIKVLIMLDDRKKKLVKERQAEGIAKARKKGIKLGRRPKEIPHNFDYIFQKVQAKEIGIMKATELLCVDYKTFKKWFENYQQ